MEKIIGTCWFCSDHFFMIFITKDEMIYLFNLNCKLKIISKIGHSILQSQPKLHTLSFQRNLSFLYPTCYSQFCYYRIHAAHCTAFTNTEYQRYALIKNADINP